MFSVLFWCTDEGKSVSMFYSIVALDMFSFLMMINDTYVQKYIQYCRKVFIECSYTCRVLYIRGKQWMCRQVYSVTISYKRLWNNISLIFCSFHKTFDSTDEKFSVIASFLSGKMKMCLLVIPLHILL